MIAHIGVLFNISRWACGDRGGLAGTGYELPNFAARGRCQTVSIGAAPPLSVTHQAVEAARRRRRGGRLSRWRTRGGARPEPVPENRRDNFALIALAVVID